jgi:23S rRNA pseudouridine1911/1915/1917 synthase
MLTTEKDKETRRPGDKEKEESLDIRSPCLPFSLSLLLAETSLLEICPLTGRKHQIRLQLAHAGFPIVGDRKYGSTRTFPAGIALHSQRLVIEHPVSKMQLEIEAPLPAAWQRFLAGRS